MNTEMSIKKLVRVQFKKGVLNVEKSPYLHYLGYKGKTILIQIINFFSAKPHKIFHNLSVKTLVVAVVVERALLDKPKSQFVKPFLCTLEAQSSTKH